MLLKSVVEKVCKEQRYKNLILGLMKSNKFLIVDQISTQIGFQFSRALKPFHII